MYIRKTYQSQPLNKYTYRSIFENTMHNSMLSIKSNVDYFLLELEQFHPAKATSDEDHLDQLTFLHTLKPITADYIVQESTCISLYSMIKNIPDSIFTCHLLLAPPQIIMFSSNQIPSINKKP